MQPLSPAVADASRPYRFPAEVDFASAREALAAAAVELEVAQPSFDLSSCQRFDSSLIAILLELSRRALLLGRRCSFLFPSANLRKLAGLYGVESLLFDDLEQVPSINDEPRVRPDGPA